MAKNPAAKMMNPKGGKSMGTGGKTRNPADKKSKGAMQGKVSSTTKNSRYC